MNCAIGQEETLGNAAYIVNLSSFRDQEEGVIGGLREQRKPVTVRNIYLDSGILITKGSRFDRILCDLSLGGNDRSDGSEQ